jgi:tetratricopeptide (TPR) repeat protein
MMPFAEGAKRMSRLLEIFGRAIEIDAADLICDWLSEVTARANSNAQMLQLGEIAKHIADGNLDLAEEKLKFHLFTDPSCTKGRMAAAAVCLHNNNVAKALESLQSVYMREPNNTTALYALGYCNERLGRPEQAVEFYQDCLKFRHYLQLPRLRLAALYFYKNQLENTIREYESLIGEYPDDISSLVTLGHLYMANLKFGPAIDTFNNAILIHPDNFLPEPEDANVFMLVQSGQLHEAAEEIRWRLDQQENNANLNVKLGDILIMLGEDYEAISHYERAFEVQPQCLEAAIKLGIHHLRLGQYSEAAEYFTKATEINDRIVEAYIGLAIAQKLACKVEESYGTLSLASAIQQNSTLLFGQAAAVQFRAVSEQDYHPEDTLNALVGIQTVIRAHLAQLSQHPYNPDIHYRYGLLLMGMGKLAQAAVAFEKTLELNPTYHRARCRLALCLCETAGPQKALEQLCLQTQCPSKDVLQLHYKTAILYCDKTNFNRALQNLERSLQLNFTDYDAGTNIATVLQNLGLMDRALTTLQRLTETASYAFDIPK